MANSVTSFYQTLVSAVSDASRLLAPTWHASHSIYWNYQSEEGGLYQTLNVPIPADPTSSVADQGAGDLVLNDIGFTTTSIVMDRHPSFAYTVRDFEQFNSPEDIRRVFLDAALKGVKNNINAAVTSLLNTTNITTNSAISASSSAITTAQFTSAMAALGDQKVPVAEDPENMTLLLPPKVYSTILDPTTGGAGAAWSQALIAGTSIAERVHTQGVFPIPTFGCTMKLDQQLPYTGTKPSRTFTAAYFHRWAIAGVTRPLPRPDGNVVDYMYVDFGSNPDYGGAYGDGSTSIPIRIMMSYNHYPKTGYVVSVDAGYGLKVIRENMCQLFTITE